MDPLLPLVVVVPLAMAAALSAANPLFRRRRRALDALAIATAACVTTLLVIVMARTRNGEEIYWFAGIHPHRGVVLGIDFAVGELNSGLAALAALLVTGSMIFSWRYFERVSTWYHALMLVFLAGMVGFCLTGDIFDLFVWFELMGVAAYALTAYRPEEKAPIQGALNFAITNSVGAYFTLSGIALVYGETGALNMAQIGTTLAKHRPDGLVVVAFVLILVGFVTKASIVPFHFWLADAHAVAPTPVCVLFSGVMVELGLYAVARVYWSMFGDALSNRATISAALLALGTTTAIVGALYCVRQRHLKRMLAFSTISHAGIFLMGISLLTPLGLAGAALSIVGHGLVKGALFLCVGIVLHRLGSVNEPRLHGRGRQLKVTGVVFTLAGLGLAGLPPFALFLGVGLIGTSASSLGHDFVTPVIMATSILVGGAVLRVAGGVFYGLGDPPSEDAQMAVSASEETTETVSGRTRTPLSMIVPASAFMLLALVTGALPGIGSILEHAALSFEDEHAYNLAVLRGVRVAHLHALYGLAPASSSSLDVATALGTAAGAVLLALGFLYWRRIPLLRQAPWPGGRLAGPFHFFQSGIVADYVTWLVLGVACFGGALAFAIR